MRPKVYETTALGAAYLAGLAVKFWKLEDLKNQWQEDQKFKPKMESEDREELYSRWSKAVERSKDWL